MSDVTKQLRAFEDSAVMPLLREIRAEAVRCRDFNLTLIPGSIAFLAANADAYECRDGVSTWQPLSVMYCDVHDRKGEVFRLFGTHDSHGTRISASEIVDCCKCVPYDKGVLLLNPFNNMVIRRIETAKSSEALLNLWYVFRGAILPLLYQNEYRFMKSYHDRVRFQAQLFHQIHSAYEGTV